jgi:hypothetical protein
MARLHVQSDALALLLLVAISGSPSLSVLALLSHYRFACPCDIDWIIPFVNELEPSVRRRRALCVLRSARLSRFATATN